MAKIRLFVSSPQEEFREERRALADYVRTDPLFGKHFEVFLFEELEATDRTPESRFLEEVDACDVYVGLFGETYGRRHGRISSTEREFDRATELGKQRLVFVKETDDSRRDAGIRALIHRAEKEVVRDSFDDVSSLIAGLHRALVPVLEERQVIQEGPFERHVAHGATWNDIDRSAVEGFVHAARASGRLPGAVGVAPEPLLTHLGLLKDGRLTMAAMLLFGAAPRDFVASSGIKCVHLLGTGMLDPIQKIETFHGSILSAVDGATDFVMTRLDSRVGERSEGPRAPRFPEIPIEAVTEAVVNAVAHRDYTSAAGVTVTLFRDRLEVYNPGGLSPPLTVEDLFRPHGSVPRNPLILNALSRTQYVEEIGTGTLRMIAECRRAGLPDPQFIMARGFVVELSRRRAWDMRQKGAAYRHIENRGTRWREEVSDALGRLRRGGSRSSSVINLEDV